MSALKQKNFKSLYSTEKHSKSYNLGKGNNPMVGMTVAVAVAIQEAADAGKF